MKHSPYRFNGSSRFYGYKQCNRCSRETMYEPGSIVYVDSPGLRYRGFATIVRWKQNAFAYDAILPDGCPVLVFPVELNLAWLEAEVM